MSTSSDSCYQRRLNYNILQFHVLYGLGPMTQLLLGKRLQAKIQGYVKYNRLYMVYNEHLKYNYASFQKMYTILRSINVTGLIKFLIGLDSRVTSSLFPGLKVNHYVL